MLCRPDLIHQLGSAHECFVAYRSGVAQSMETRVHFFSTYDRNGTYSQKRVMFHANTYKHIVRALFDAADCSRSKLKLPNCHATAPPHKRDVNLW